MKKILWSEKIKKPPRFLTIEPFLRKQDRPIKSHPEARQPRIVPLVVLDYGSIMARFKQMKYVGQYMLELIKEMAISAKSIKSNPYVGKNTIDPETLAEMETYAISLGVTDIGYTVVNTRHIFNGFKILYKYAIVFTMEMNKEKIKQAPTIPSFIEIFRTYHTLGVIVNKVSVFLREKGFNAQAEPAIGGDINYIPVAIDAGLGYSGKNGLLITPNHGPRIRLAAVLTDIENLPIQHKNPHLWVRDYCETCNVCVKKCPSDAIYLENKNHPDGGPIFIDHTKCALPFSNDNGCTLCIKYCPFSYGTYDKIKTIYEAAR